MIDWSWRNGFGYFVTYYGEIYHGMTFQFDLGTDDFFIISKNKAHEFHALKQNERTFEKLSALGFYIQSKDVILDRIDENHLEIKFKGEQSKVTGAPFNEFKKMFVFGAGASAFYTFGEGKQMQFRPPLGQELFAPRFDSFIKNYPGLKYIIPRFVANKNDIENIMESDWESIIANKNVNTTAQHIQIQFYLKDLFCEISNEISDKHYRYNLFLLFAQNLFAKKGRYSFVSFNYDTLLESSLMELFPSVFNHTDDYLAQKGESNFFLFKPHGSWNWGWSIPDSLYKKYNCSLPDLPRKLYDVRITPGELYYKLLGNLSEMSNGWGQEALNDPNMKGKLTLNKDLIKVHKNANYYPAMLLPFRDKDEFVMPYQHQLFMRTTLESIEELTLIGWKGNEKLFNTKLKQYAKMLKKITIVNPDLDAVKNELSPYLDLTKYEIQHIKSFEEYVLHHMNTEA